MLTEIKERDFGGLYRAVVRSYGLETWEENYPGVDVSRPIELSSQDHELLGNCGVLVENFRLRREGSRLKNGEAAVMPALRSEAGSILEACVEVRMVCLSVQDTLKEWRARQKMAWEDKALGLAQKTLVQVGSLQGRRDREELLETLIRLWRERDVLKEECWWKRQIQRLKSFPLEIF